MTQIVCNTMPVDAEQGNHNNIIVI